MDASLLEILKCPFCGTAMTLWEGNTAVQPGRELDYGVLGCQCCAFPVVAGIPVIVVDDRARAAMKCLDQGMPQEALVTMLGGGEDPARGDAIRAMLDRLDAVTFQEAIGILSPDAEGTYFVYRFSDPTFVMAHALIDGIGQHAAPRAGRILDLCGGSGHLTRLLDALDPAGGTYLADLFFWKLWLAKTFTVPRCIPICCNGNNPLPFVSDTFSMVVLADAFPYIWQKRMLADDMVRISGPRGTIVMPHLHSSLGWNFSQGMALTPDAYAGLFSALEPRLFSDRKLLDEALERGAVDLSSPQSAEAIGDEASFTLIATKGPALYRRHETLPVAPPAAVLKPNPLYKQERRDGSLVLTLAFPTPGYEEEFGECLRYLPPTITLPAELTMKALGADYESLRRRRIIIDVPANYC